MNFGRAAFVFPLFFGLAAAQGLPEGQNQAFQTISTEENLLELVLPEGVETLPERLSLSPDRRLTLLFPENLQYLVPGKDRLIDASVRGKVAVLQVHAGVEVGDAPLLVGLTAMTASGRAVIGQVEIEKEPSGLEYDWVRILWSDPETVRNPIEEVKRFGQGQREGIDQALLKALDQAFEERFEQELIRSALKERIRLPLKAVQNRVRYVQFELLDGFLLGSKVYLQFSKLQGGLSAYRFDRVLVRQGRVQWPSEKVRFEISTERAVVILDKTILSAPFEVSFCSTEGFCVPLKMEW